MLFSLEAIQLMHPGQRKDKEGNPHQEDSIFPAPGNLNNSDRLFVLCDGMGGHDAGEVASDTVCRTLGQYITSECKDGFTPDCLDSAISNAFDALDAVDTGAARKMGTTMVMLNLYDKGAVVAHIGDSRLYHIRPAGDGSPAEVLFHTSDHSLVSDLVKAGIITEDEARTSPHKNVITKAMQPNLEHRPAPDTTKITDIRPGDYFYLCSDGMIENMGDAELAGIFSSSSTPLEQLRDTLLDLTRDNHDNHTAFIIRILAVDETGDGDLSDDFDKVSMAPAAAPPVFDSDRFGNRQQPADSDDSRDDDITSLHSGESEITDPNVKTGHTARRRWLIFGIIVLVMAAIALAAYLLFVNSELTPDDIRAAGAVLDSAAGK